MRRRILVFLVTTLLSAPAAFAQQGTADIRGRVVDQQGAVLPGVTVVVRHQESGLFRETVTGADGLFLMSAMTPGIYEVSAELPGLQEVLAPRRPARSRCAPRRSSSSSKSAG